jgi:hypothetical protein
VQAPNRAVVTPLAPVRRTRIDWFLAVPLIGPLLLFFAGSADFLFDSPGLVDTFGMVGRFWHYTDHNPLFEEYKNSRLPWILPGFVLHHLFDEVTASYILHLTVLLGSSAAVYLIMRDTLHDRPVAAITAAAWSSYTWIHENGGWNYHVRAASAYYLCALWMVARSTTAAHRRRWLIGAGAFLVSAIHTHIVFAGFVPVAALTYFPALKSGIRNGWRDLATAAGYVAAGAVGTTVLLGAIDVATGGSWLFFSPQIEYTLFFAREGNRWLIEPAAWMRGSLHLVIPCVVLLGGLLWLTTTWFKRLPPGVVSQFRYILVLQGILAFCVMAYFQFVGRQTMFDYPYVTVPLFCHIFPMLGALLWPSTHLGDRLGFWVAVVAALVIVAPLLLLLPSWLPAHAPAIRHALHLPDTPFVMAPFLMGIAALLLCSIWSSGRIGVFSIAYAFLNAWLAITPSLYGIETGGINRDVLVVFRSLDRFATALDPSLFAIRYWGEPGIVQSVHGPINLADVFSSFRAVRRRNLVTAAYDRPGIRADELTQQDLYSASCLGVLSTPEVHADLVRRISHRFADIGQPLRPVGHHEARSTSISIALTVLTTRPANDPRPGLLPCPPMP